MGRFNHEAIAVDPRTGIVYETEDREDGIFYRFLPTTPGELKAGGKLQALCIVGADSKDLRNWGPDEPIDVGAKLRVRWIDMDDVESPDDDLRQRGFEAGAARFARGEGIWYSDGQFYIACTNGGQKQKGQIWKYVPAEQEGQGGADDSGTLELFVESRDSELLENCDNITMSPWGDLVMCEDRERRPRAAGRRHAPRRALHAGRPPRQERVRGRLLHARRHDAAGEHPAPRADDRDHRAVAAPRLKARSHMSFEVRRGIRPDPSADLGATDANVSPSRRRSCLRPRRRRA